MGRVAVRGGACQGGRGRLFLPQRCPRRGAWGRIVGVGNRQSAFRGVRMIRLLAVLSALAFVVAVGPLLAEDAKKEPAFKMTADEKKILELTNAERAKEKLPPLAPNPTLFKIARLHSAN